MKSFIISCAFFLFLNSCGIINTSYEIQKKFAYCYDGQYTGLDTLININGYYSIGEVRDMYGVHAIFTHRIDTINIFFMFWPDGTFLYNFFDYDHDIPNYFRKIVENTMKGKKDKFYKHFSWGRYIICGDTIKTQYMHTPNGLNDFWYGYEISFHIINRTTLKYLPSESKILDYYATETEITEMKETQIRNKYLPATFVPVEVLPNSNCWIKNKKWFWCDKEKYKKWKDSQK